MRRYLSGIGALLITALSAIASSQAHALCWQAQIDAVTIMRYSTPWSWYGYNAGSWTGLSGSGNGSTGSILTSPSAGPNCSPGVTCSNWTWSCTQHGTDSGTGSYLDCSGRQTSSGTWQGQFIAYCQGSTPEHSDHWVYNVSPNPP